MNKIVTVNDLIIQLEQDIRATKQRLSDAEWTLERLKEKIQQGAPMEMLIVKYKTIKIIKEETS
ncbi:MAG: hypothetical protein A3K77_00130 [Euryarchaeota archaeon RBG_13_31_8]|nr:MAG: hypothetical protein A3K77_00130 [Euryarchaeota archaeon RBG_13_31_8]